MNDELKEMKDDYGLDKHEAEEVSDLADEFGIDADDAHEIWEAI
jgi:hypothetical protein